jgi:hypothetical protein
MKQIRKTEKGQTLSLTGKGQTLSVIFERRACVPIGTLHQMARLNVQLRAVRTRPGKGSRHTIFVAQKPRKYRVS